MLPIIRRELVAELALAGVALVLGLATARHALRSASVGDSRPRPTSASGAQPGAASHRFAQANLVLISIDTLRADHLGVYGYHRPTSPRLEDFAHQGLVFERFHQSGGGTLDSHVSMMTSLRPGTHGITPQSGRRLEEERVTLAETLKAAGYSTAAFVDDGYLDRKYGLGQGFDAYDDSGGHFAEILPRAQHWLEAHQREPLFLFLHTYDVHSAFDRLSYECPGDYPRRYLQGSTLAFDGCRRGRCASALLAWVNAEARAGRLTVGDVFSRAELDFMAALYDGCINYVDARLADLFGLLQALNLYDKSIIVVTSDHGEEFGEHGLLIHDNTGYEELAHVPLLIRLPGGLYAGTRSSQLAAMVDLMPTLLDLLEIGAPAETQGVSLLPVIRQGTAVQKSTSIYDNLHTGRWKLIGSKQELYDLVNDPGETHNLYSENPRLASLLVEVLRAEIGADWRARQEFSKRVPPQLVVLDDGTRQRLRALGYLGN